jgi:putative transposase
MMGANKSGGGIWHMLVDMEGNLIDVLVTGADVSDLQGGKRLLEPLNGLLPRMELLWGDSHYGGQMVEWAKEHLGWVVQTVRRLGTARDEQLIEPKPKTEKSKGGFQVLPKRWVVERSLGWIVRGL